MIKFWLVSVSASFDIPASSWQRTCEGLVSCELQRRTLQPLTHPQLLIQGTPVPEHVGQGFPEGQPTKHGHALTEQQQTNTDVGSGLTGV